MAIRTAHLAATSPSASADARVSAVVAGHERALMRVALHWSLCRDDALDAYQRALEIYVRRLDTLDPATEIAWLKVVVKHEALTIRRQRSESVPVDAADLDLQPADTQRPLDELLAGREQVTRSAEALRRLKRDEAKALVLKAQGLSYAEIGDHLGWTYTKVNRCITEGRARFLKVYAEIEAGAECERFAPTLAALAGGTATADALLDLRPHIRNCAACRATVRDLHATRLGRLSALWPIPVLIAPLRWLATRTPAPPAPPTDYYPDADAVLRDLDLPDNPPSRLLELKAHAYDWWHRLLGSDVATSAQLAASAGGGGRIATLGAIVGFCLSGLGAGTVCIVSGIVDNPFSRPPAHESADKAREPKRHETPTRRPKDPAPTVVPAPQLVQHTPPRRATRRDVPAETKQRVSTQRSHEQSIPAAPPVGATKDFAFEQVAPAATPRPAPAPVTGGGEFAP